ncbi:MAG TPA: hypothetical protein VJU15_03055 [Gemmatimonadales bacterium]|nr:hypothetical protein [Gemmatimonadales bacterium]
MKRTLSTTLLLGTVVTFPLAGQAPASTELDGCSFISGADVQSVTGEMLERSPRPTNRAYGTVQTWGCNYKSAGWTVETHVETGRSKDGLALYLKGLGATVKQTTENALKPVAGLGDQAWWGPVNPTNGMLHVVRGTDVIWVQTYGKGAGAGTLEKTRAITEKVLEGYKRARPS